MQQIEVDDIGLQVAERAFNVQPCGLRIAGSGLGHEIDLVAVFAREVLSVEAFGVAFHAVGIGGVEKTDAAGDGDFDGLGQIVSGEAAIMLASQAEESDPSVGVSQQSGGEERAMFVAQGSLVVSEETAGPRDTNGRSGGESAEELTACIHGVAGRNWTLGASHYRITHDADSG